MSTEPVRGPGGALMLPSLANYHHRHNPLSRTLVRQVGDATVAALKRKHPILFKAGGVLARLGKRLSRIPSMAEGGMVHAPKRVGKLVRLHDGELVIPAKKVPAILNDRMIRHTLAPRKGPAKILRHVASK